MFCVSHWESNINYRRSGRRLGIKMLQYSLKELLLNKLLLHMCLCTLIEFRMVCDIQSRCDLVIVMVVVWLCWSGWVFGLCNSCIMVVLWSFRCCGQPP